MNRGTFSGDIAEIEFVKLFNTEKKSNRFKEYIDQFNSYNVNNIYMVRVQSNIQNYLIKM